MRAAWCVVLAAMPLCAQSIELAAPDNEGHVKQVSGRDFRLTDVAGNAVRDIFAR